MPRCMLLLLKIHDSVWNEMTWTGEGGGGLIGCSRMWKYCNNVKHFVDNFVVVSRPLFICTKYFCHPRRSFGLLRSYWTLFSVWFAMAYDFQLFIVVGLLFACFLSVLSHREGENEINREAARRLDIVLYCLENDDTMDMKFLCRRNQSTSTKSYSHWTCWIINENFAHTAENMRRRESKFRIKLPIFCQVDDSTDSRARLI